MPTARAIISLDTLRTNALRLMDRAGDARLIAVVKANAYGHGAVPVTRVLEQVGVDFFAVATVEEAIELREAGVTSRILVMSSLVPRDLARYEQHAVEPTIGSQVSLDAVCDRDAPRIAIHLKIDTGMGRIGLQPSQVDAAIERVRRSGRVTLAGISTHFASADEDDLTHTQQQIEIFTGALSKHDIDDVVVHMSNTEGLARLAAANWSFAQPMVRVGIGLYGCPIRADSRNVLELKPAMRLEAVVTNVKEVEAGTPISYNARWRAPVPTRIATVGIGYADGYRRILRDRAEVGVNGRRCPVVGTICMDMVMVDLGLTGVDIDVGDWVVVFGDGGPDISEVAAWAETIPYEILTGLGSRIARRYE